MNKALEDFNHGPHGWFILYGLLSVGASISITELQQYVSTYLFQKKSLSRLSLNNGTQGTYIVFTHQDLNKLRRPVQ